MNGITTAKRECAHCERSDVPLGWDSEGRLVCPGCLEAAEESNARLRAETAERRARARRPRALTAA